MTGRATAAALAVAVALVACGCGSSDPPSADGAPTSASSGRGSTDRPGTDGSAPDRSARPYPVTVVEEVLVDTSRPLLDPGGTEIDDRRTLPTTVHVPQGEGPFPLVVFAHGFGGDPQRFSALLDTWAAAGYVVAAPTFPLTSSRSPHLGPEAWAGIADQPGDLSFVADQVVARADEPPSDDDPLAGAVDPTRLAAAGMSLGGGTVYGIGFDDCCLDERVDAVVVLGGMPFPLGGELDLASGTPTLVVHGDADATLPYAQAEQAFGQLTAPRFLVTLTGGSHSPPYEDWDSPWDGVVEAVTVDFFDAYLAGGDAEDRAAAVARLRADAVDGEVATVVIDP